MTIKQSIWLRAEIKPHERRAPLTPTDAHELIKHKYKVVVERSKMRIFKDDDYLRAGCKLVDAGTWTDAPLNTYILGIKELPDSDAPLKHHHIYFAHAYKEQDGAEQLLNRFNEGRGLLYDLEFLQDNNGHRVTVFSYWAGVAGCAATLLLWIQKQNNQVFKIPEFFPDESSLVATLKEGLSTIKKPTSLVIGAQGRCARGVRYFLKKLQLDKTLLYKKDTVNKTSYPEILKHDLFFNCVYLREKTVPFVTNEQLTKTTNLSIIADISCDPNSPYNPLPIYKKITTFKKPTVRVAKDPLPVDVMAIDHLPSFLPKESSNDFSGQLLPHLLELLEKGNTSPVWTRAEEFFNAHTKEI
jgi:saccharopine dehydrogenase (NAD+, L-lysine forming)